jgi:ribonuclease D
MLKAEITREELNELPLAGFEGNIHLITEARQINGILQKLKNLSFVGFDTETRPAFIKGQRYPISLTQLASEEEVFLIRNKYTGWPESLVNFLADPSVLKIGVGIRDDIKSIQSELNNEWKPEGFVELNNVVKDLGIISQGIRKLSGLVLGFRVSKSAQTSNWEKENLNEKQLRYAATDAWCCHRIYSELLIRGYLN